MAEVELGALVAGAAAEVEEVLAVFTVGDSEGIVVRVSVVFVELFEEVVDIAEVGTAGINVKEDLS